MTSTPENPTRYASATQPGLFFWVERAGSAFMVVQGVEGFPATEALDDWPAHFEDADALARQLAAGGVV